MWKLVDYKSESFNAGNSVDFDYYFLLENQASGERRWVDEFDYNQYKRLGLVG